MKISNDINEAAFWLSQNKVVAIPTETVYGLAANIYNEAAVNSIYKIKNRPSNNPLIVHIKSTRELYKYVENIPVKASLLAKYFWPGPLTLVLKKAAHIPDYITSNKDTVAIRVPAHPATLKLLESLLFPLAAPSANPSNSVSSTTAQHVLDYFGDKLPFILDGGSCAKGLESTIVGFEKGEPIIYRLGALSIEHIERVIGKVEIRNNATQSPDAPGMFSKHYAPKTPLYITNDLETFLTENNTTNIAFLGFDKSLSHSKITQNYLLSAEGNYDEAATNLYKTLIEIDSKNFDLIVTQYLPEIDLGKSINDRLSRAAFKIN
ncbi:L-threonylcarbamoyladenylate synthase [Flavobacterium gelidilacus]|uniref:L-threonylcarbamoyladenylate synthase n=1 Tax=Flavobacterium gelidilacus TaxID=206041 RepID=UPI000425BD2A|nr:L-threonylcarbamoyladenylate synthase [Flavobacterium gelidilacus]